MAGKKRVSLLNLRCRGNFSRNRLRTASLHACELVDLAALGLYRPRPQGVAKILPLHATEIFADLSGKCYSNVIVYKLKYESNFLSFIFIV